MVDDQLISNASQSLNVLAKAFSQAGDTDAAELLFRQAADLELASPELQSCWGGPFNGQKGRQVLVDDLLRILNPAAVVETGTFRGITTAWLAENYAGPVLTCEKEKLYYLQAKARLGRLSNVSLHLQDSRLFLREIVPTFPHQAILLFYLDAHWELDLPLKEELQIIFASHRNAVVLIDDFKVPDDGGYGWDNYGPGKSLDLELLDGVIPSDGLIFFPSMRSGDETGEVRGCCVIACDAATKVAESKSLRGDSLQGWARDVERRLEEARELAAKNEAWARDVERHLEEARELAATNEARGRDVERRLEEARELAAKNEGWARDVERRLEEVRELAANNEAWAQRTEALLAEEQKISLAAQNAEAALRARLEDLEHSVGVRIAKRLRLARTRW